MDDLLPRARANAQALRFSGDLRAIGDDRCDVNNAVHDIHYQDAIEISASLTPALFTRLQNVCHRLQVPVSAVVAFIYSSPHVQAECVTIGSRKCIVRFSSGMLDLLTEDEFEFVAGHEIGHFLLDHRPIATDRSSPQAFVQQRSQEISADRLGLLACGSLETALRALMKTVSGLTEKHLRFDVSAFVSQLRKIESGTADWSGSTHPSIVIRAKALIWLSLTEFLLNEPHTWSTERKEVLDQRVERDLKKFIDGAIKKKIDDKRRDLMLWMMTYEITRSGAFKKRHQSIMKRMFDVHTVERLISFVGGLSRAEVDDVIRDKVGAARTQLESLIPLTFDAELGEMRARIEAELNEG